MQFKAKIFKLKVLGMGFVVVPPKAKEPFVVTGRLASSLDTWKVLTGDTLVLHAI